MATLSELDLRGDILRWAVELPDRQQINRLIYVSPRFAHWAQTVLPTLTTRWDIEQTPMQQLEELGEIFVAGEPLTFDRQIKPLVHHGDGVWYLKTIDLRIFGWFPKKDHFVIFCAGDATFIKDHNLYHGHAGEVVYFRSHLPLDEPKFIEGDDPNAVISALYYP